MDKEKKNVCETFLKGSNRIVGDTAGYLEKNNETRADSLCLHFLFIEWIGNNCKF